MRFALLSLGFALMASHEIDAALAAEWRLLFVLRGLDDDLTASVFTLVHVPLFFALLWALFHANVTIQLWSRRLFMGFLVVHAGLHWRLSDHPLYGFSGWDSNLLIFGAGLAGLVYLASDGWLSPPAPSSQS